MTPFCQILEQTAQESFRQLLIYSTIEYIDVIRSIDSSFLSVFMWKVIVGSKGKVRRITGPWQKTFQKITIVSVTSDLLQCSKSDVTEFRDGKPVIS